MFLESSTYNFTSHTQRLLFGSWFLMLVILMNTFVGYMESSLMLKEETDRLDNIEQLALAPEVRPMVFEAAGFLKIIEVTGTINSNNLFFRVARTILVLHYLGVYPHTI